MEEREFEVRYCERGHATSSSDRAFRDAHCAKCGARFVVQCPNCSIGLRWPWKTPVFVGGDPARRPPPAPKACTKCGRPFPWTTAAELSAKGASTQDAVAAVIRLCERFHLFVRELRTRHNSRRPLKVSDEYDVQDLFRALLRLHFDDIRPEENTPTYAGKSGRIDFLLNGETIGVEVKMTRPGLDAKKIGEELIEDIARYKAHPSCKTLVFFVYDPEERISNPSGLIKDLSMNTPEFIVHVVIVPQGH